jgi:hypothetical protein
MVRNGGCFKAIDFKDDNNKALVAEADVFIKLRLF